ncbi:MAG: hypothetical protein WAM44_17325, partial [Chthoniobacterales bacterium]
MIHSEEYIEDSRFQWWNPDYLDLLIKRFALREAKSILEVGTGLGHWSRPLLKRIPTEWTFHGFQRGIRTSNNGDHNIGAYLPSVLKTAGFHSIEAYTNDKASFTFPGSYDPSECEAIWEDARVI